MRVWVIDEMVYIKNQEGFDRVFILQHGKIYSVPDKWGKVMLINEVAAEYIQIGGNNNDSSRR